MMNIVDYLQKFVELMNSGGVIMWVLFALNILLWYGLGYRYILLQRGTRGNVRRQVQKHLKRKTQQKMRGLLDYAISDAIKTLKESKDKNLQNCRNYLSDTLYPYTNDLGRYAILVKTIVVLAPLVGLLGTVDGMIETFDALQSSAMFGQGASISGGISKALFTTELGLVVAVPGLILGRVLDKKEERLEHDFELIKDILCTRSIS